VRWKTPSSGRSPQLDGTPFPSTARLASRWLLGRAPGRRHQARAADLEAAYCAQVLAVTCQAMGLLPGRRPDRYDPGSFWSGDHLGLSAAGFRLGGEIAMQFLADMSTPHTPAAPDADLRGQ
jgi:hypothetical protein